MATSNRPAFTWKTRGRRSRRLCNVSCWGAVVLLFGSPAIGTIGPPVKIRMPSDTPQAVSGTEYQGLFEIDVRRAGVISEVEISGRGWSVHAVELATTPFEAVPGVLRLPFRATPENADEPIGLTLTFDGRHVSRTYRIGPAAFAQHGKSGKALRVVPASTEPALPPSPLKQEDTPAAAAFGATRLRFVGRIVYDRPTAVDINGMPAGPTSEEGVDGIWVELMDEDLIDSETIWSGLTDADGYFDTGDIDWDDCDIAGCDSPDVYVRWECDTGIVNVQDAEDLLEPDFSWSTLADVIDDFPGGFYDFGTLKPADPAQMPALHIHNSITRAWKFVRGKSGTGLDVDEVDVLWPDGDNAFYDPNDEEIHISVNRQWNESTHTHEYGHHFLSLFSVNTEPDYCNGFCDQSSGDCGHCRWCRETDHDAWNEGWPNWLADIVTRDYPLTYRFSNGTHWTALIPRSQESLDVCATDGMAHDPFLTEGFVGALLGDMEDAAQDDHDGGATDCDMDAMALGPDEIFTVVVQDKPTTVAQFISMFRARYPEHDQDLWSTGRNVAPAYITFPAPVPEVTPVTPSCVTYRSGQRIELRVAGNGSLLKYQWRREGASLADGGRFSGATTPTLVIDPSQINDTGFYNCLVSTCDETRSYPSPLIRVHISPSPIGGMAALGFGRNHSGQTGRGSLCGENCAFTPWPVMNLSSFANIGANEWHTVGVLTDGTVWGWGDNSYGAAVGHATPTYALPVPEAIPEVTNALTASAGNLHSVALRADGKIFAWGYNGYGSLGVPDPAQYQPIEVPGIECMIAAEAGDYHTLALGSDGTVWAWGLNSEGQLGRGSTSFYESKPAPVSGLSDVVAVAAGGQHNLAIKADGTLWAWGWNSQGQLGDGTQNRRTTPFQVPGLTTVTAVAAGVDHSMALLANGSVRAWGAGSGKLGDGGVNRSLVPITPTGMNANVIAIAAGYYHSLFLRNDRTVWGCGYNYNGQLASPGQPLLYTPTQIAGLNDVSAIFGRGETCFVLVPGVAPSFLATLSDQNRKVGEALVWNAPRAAGTPQLAFLWKHGDQLLTNGDGISGATTDTLTISPVRLLHAGQYTCVVSNGYGTAHQSASLAVRCIDADLNCDERVESADAQVLMSCVTGPAIPGPPGDCSPAQFAASDLDNDGDVDQDDFGRFQRCIAGPEQVPSPSCAD